MDETSAIPCDTERHKVREVEDVLGEVKECGRNVDGKTTALLVVLRCSWLAGSACHAAS